MARVVNRDHHITNRYLCLRHHPRHYLLPDYLTLQLPTPYQPNLQPKATSGLGRICSLNPRWAVLNLSGVDVRELNDGCVDRLNFKYLNHHPGPHMHQLKLGIFFCHTGLFVRA